MYYLTLFVNLIVAVGVGLFITNMLTIERLSGLQYQEVKTISDVEALKQGVAIVKSNGTGATGVNAFTNQGNDPDSYAYPKSLKHFQFSLVLIRNP